LVAFLASFRPAREQQHTGLLRAESTTSMAEPMDGGLSAEVLAKHGHSSQPESQQVRLHGSSVACHGLCVSDSGSGQVRGRQPGACSSHAGGGGCWRACAACGIRCGA